MLQALAEAEADIEESFRDEPLIRASVQNTLGLTYQRLGEFEKARPLLRGALETRRDLLGEWHEDTAESQLRWGWLLRVLNEHQEAEEALFAAEPVLRELAAADDESGEAQGRLAAALDQIGWLRMDLSQFEESQSFFQEALEVRSIIFKAPAEELAASHQSIGAAWANLG